MLATAFPRLRCCWLGRAVASTGFVAVLEVALLRALLSDADLVAFFASKQFVALFLAGIGIFAWSTYIRPGATPNGADVVAGVPPEERHRGIVRSFSEQHGCGIIACIDEEEWPGSDNVRFYLADKERLGLQTDDVVAFHIILDRQSKDGSFRAVNIRYAYDDAPRRLTSTSNSQGRADSQRRDDMDFKQREASGCAINCSSALEKHVAHLRPSIQKDCGSVQDGEEQSDKTGSSAADHVPTTRLGKIKSSNDSQNMRKIPATSASNSGHPCDVLAPESIESRLQSLAAQRECENDVVNFLELDRSSGANSKAGRRIDHRLSSHYVMYSVQQPWAEVASEPTLDWRNFGLPQKEDGEPVLLTTKNTFLHVEDTVSDAVPRARLKRSSSDSDISSSSRFSSSTGSAAEKNIRLGDKGSERCMYWLPSSEAHSLADGLERSEAKQVPMPTKINIQVAETDDCSFWFPPSAQPPEQPMYVETCEFIEQGRPSSFLGNSDSHQLQNKDIGSDEIFPEISRSELQSLRPLSSEVAVADEPSAPEGDVIDSAWGARHSEMRLVMELHEETGTPIEELMALFSEGVLQQIPRNDDGEFTTVGSISHQAGECRACVFWFRKSCQKGVQCTFCHFVHKGQKQKRIRPSKATRERLRREALEVAENAPACTESPEIDPDLEGELFADS